MPLFVSHRLYDPLLPLDYLDLLRKLDRFAQLADELQGHPPSGSNDRRPERLRRHHEDLLELAETLLPPTPDLVHERAAAKAFAEGAMLLLHYERSVLGGGEFKDTLGSRTLSAFRCDLADPSEAETEAWIAAVRKAKPMLGTTAEACELAGPDAEGRARLRLSTGSRMHRDRLRSPDVQKILRDALQEVCGRPVSLDIEVDGASGGRPGGAGRAPPRRRAAPRTGPVPPEVEMVRKRFDGTLIDPTESGG